MSLQFIKVSSGVVVNAACVEEFRAVRNRAPATFVRDGDEFTIEIETESRINAAGWFATENAAQKALAFQIDCLSKGLNADFAQYVRDPEQEGAGE